ncbi:hypothetical protein, partial [Flavonifractor plautii]
DICKPCLFVFLRNLFYLTLKGGTRQVVKAEIRLWYFCGQTRKRRSFHCGVFYECHVLIKKMCTLESSKGRRRRPSRKKPVATRVVVRAHASEQVVGARLFAEKEKQSKLCSNVVGVSLKDL